MQLIRRFRIPALFCAFAVLVCELISRPYTSMGIDDDGPYILMAHTLANTGHFAYNGWAAPMIGWQLYLGAAFIKLFGFSFTTVRMSTLLIAMALAFILQRTLVRAGITEHNATLGTLALVLSPLYLMLSVTFLTDIFGLFAIVLCLYGCLRALQSSTSRTAIAWLCFAVITNAICGTSRQIAWLGILVMLPSTLWLLRAQRRGQPRVLLAGAAATLAGAIFILACMQWLKHQPYIIPEHLLPDAFPVAPTLAQLFHTFLDAPFLLLPIFAIFLPQVRNGSRSSKLILAVISLGYILLALRQRHLPFLEPTVGAGNWVNIHGIYDAIVSLSDWQSHPPVFLNTGVRSLLTIASLGGLLGLMGSLAQSCRKHHSAETSAGLSWRQLGVLLAPFTIAYTLLLLPRAATNGLWDRYLLPLLVVVLLCLVRYYQQQIRPGLPVAAVLLVIIMTFYGIVINHNTFALYRARVALAAELRANGIPDTSVDNGWEYNFDVELQHADHINFPTIEVPAHAYVTVPPPAGVCQMLWYNLTPHIHALYGISFQPSICYGPAPFAPVHYSRWPYRTPGTLYVVHYTRQSQP